jgi:hypothetical protein
MLNLVLFPIFLLVTAVTSQDTTNKTVLYPNRLANSIDFGDKLPPHALTIVNLQDVPKQCLIYADQIDSNTNATQCNPRRMIGE